MYVTGLYEVEFLCDDCFLLITKVTELCFVVIRHGRSNCTRITKHMISVRWTTVVNSLRLKNVNRRAVFGLYDWEKNSSHRSNSFLEKCGVHKLSLNFVS